MKSRLYFGILSLLLLCLSSSVNVSAQTFKIESFQESPTDLSASMADNVRVDLNGKPCALVKVHIPLEDISFEGNVIGDTPFRKGEYWVFMSEGSKHLQLKHKNTKPYFIDFGDFGIGALESRTTYILQVSPPQEITSEVNFKISPQNARLMVDNIEQKVVNGSARVKLTHGDHSYLVVAPGYEIQSQGFNVDPKSSNKIIIELDVNTTSDIKEEIFTIKPIANISPTMMNVLYAGIDNPISISVPGVPLSALEANMTNGSLIRNGESWIARPGNLEKESEIIVLANIDGRKQQVGTMKFKVLKLPAPTPYIEIREENGTILYTGTPARISKTQLLSASELGVAMEEIFNLKYTVLSFSMIFFDSMGNALQEHSDGAAFSARQLDKIKQLKPGKSFFISDVQVVGPDGSKRYTSPMEVGLSNK